MFQFPTRLRAAATYYGLKTSLLSWRYKRHHYLHIGDNEHYNVKMKKHKNNILKLRVISFFPETTVPLKWISPLNCHFIGNTLRSTATEVTTEQQPKSQLGVTKDTQVVFHIPWCFGCLFISQFPKQGQVCHINPGSSGTADSPRPGCFPSLHLVPSPLVLTFPLVSGGQTSVSQQNICTLVVPDVHGAAEPGPQASGGGDTDESCCWVCSALRYIKGTAQVNAHGKRFPAGKTGSLFMQVVTVLTWLQLIIISVGFDNASLRQ